MKLKKIIGLFSIVLPLSSQTAFSASDTITYQNTRGSVLTLKFGPNPVLTGQFTTAVASKECQQAIGTHRPIVGYIVDNALAFSVSYPMCGSVITLIGNIEKNKALIDMTGIVAHQSTNIAKEGPGARMISHDVFTRVG